MRRRVDEEAAEVFGSLVLGEPPSDAPRPLPAYRCPVCKELSQKNARGLPNFRCDNGHRWWAPWPGPQTRFLSLTCFEALYGGAAGGGKTASLLIDAARNLGKGYGADYRAILLRRTFPELEGSLIKESLALYPQLGGRYNQGKHYWRFPGGEHIEFGHAQHETDVLTYKGDEFQYIGFDELTSFLKFQYTYLFSRLRSSKGVPCRARGATNPGGDGHEWAFERWEPWLDTRPEYKGRRGDSGEILYYRLDGDNVVACRRSDEGAFGRTFIAARLEDNPALHVGGDYERTALAQLDPVERARLRRGDWLVKPAKGAYFKRSQFVMVDQRPATVRARIRYWDRAGTDKETADWTVGVLMSIDKNGGVTVEHVERFRGEPSEVAERIENIGVQDGESVVLGLEQDPGQAGKADVGYLVDRYTRKGLEARAYPKRVNKIVAAGPFSAAVASPSNNVRIVRGAWNENYLAELEQFPEGSNDDQVDGSSGAFTQLQTLKGRGRVDWETIPQGGDGSSFDSRPIG